MQRKLKVLGKIARLWHRDGKAGYLADLPRVIAYVLEVAPKYRELDALRQLIERDVLPRFQDGQVQGREGGV